MSQSSLPPQQTRNDSPGVMEHNFVDTRVTGLNIQGIQGAGAQNIIGTQIQSYAPNGYEPPRTQQNPTPQRGRQPQEQPPRARNDCSMITCNRVSTYVTGMSMQGVSSAGGETTIKEQTQSVGGQLPQSASPPGQELPRRSTSPPQDTTSNHVYTNVIGTNIQGISGAGGYNYIGVQHQVYTPSMTQEEHLAQAFQQFLLTNPQFLEQGMPSARANQPSTSLNHNLPQIADAPDASSDTGKLFPLNRNIVPHTLPNPPHRTQRQ